MYFVQQKLGLRDSLARLRFAFRLLALPGQRRYLGRWLISLRPGYLLRAGLPWLNFDALDALARLELRGRQVFEYGSGGSTLYWLRRGATVVSIEHDPAWYEQVRAAIPPDAPLDYRLVPPEPAPADSADCADPAAYRSCDPAFAGWSFARYAAQIDAFPEGSFDLVLVDGRARPSCLAHAAPRVRPGGTLILDNSDRAYYTTRLGSLFNGWSATVYAGATPGASIFSAATFYVRGDAVTNLPPEAAAGRVTERASSPHPG
ncbi:MAG: hypothetical protein RMK84_01305 [Oscillochloridaceae bacterium]|nr:hypothetical protein [Chloroflexaceae bacterium]MDW8388736.1 hypothetical protein [Oscillochloridaceae bacterium]